MSRLAWVAVAALAWGAPLAAQPAVTLEGRGLPELDRRIAAILASGPLRVITVDTTLARGDTLPGPVLVAGATVYVEGTVAGDVVAVDANVFLRPPARIAGDVVSVAGGLYRSELATVEGEIVDRPTAPYGVVVAPGAIRIVGGATTRRWTLHGFRGFHAPVYDRVDALTLRWGATHAFAVGAATSGELDATAALRTARWAPAGSLELRLRGGGGTLAAGAERATVTNEAWIRDPYTNSLDFLFTGRDYRDYYARDRVYVRAEREWGGEATGAALGVRFQRERDRSLAAGDPWTLTGDAARENPPTDDGRIDGASLEGRVRWRGARTAFGAGVELEAGRGPAGDEPRGFGRHQAGGRLSVATFGDQWLHITGRFQGPLPGTDRLPRQRWSFVGGYGTLPTFPIGRFRGDRLAFVESRYVAPLGVRLPLLGDPDLHLIHAAGGAWTDGDADEVPAPAGDAGRRRRLEQNLGIELRSWSPFLGVAIDPARGLRDAALYLGFTLPVERAPWR